MKTRSEARVSSACRAGVALLPTVLLFIVFRMPLVGFPAPSNRSGSAHGSDKPMAGGLSLSEPQPQSQISVAVNPPASGLTPSQSVVLGAAVTSDPSGQGVTWSVSGSSCSGNTCGTLSAITSTSVKYTAPTAGGVYIVTATSVADLTRSATATIGVTDLAGVYTYRNDNQRSGTNSKEYALTPSNVNASSFGKIFSCAVDEAVYAQPLWVANVAVGGSTHNVVIVATMNDTVYAFDADNGSGTACTLYWKASLLTPAYGAAPGATPVPAADTQETGDIPTVIGVTSTPVIDPTTNNLYVVSKTKENGSYFQRLHKLVLANGAEASGSPVTLAATVTGSGKGSSGNSLPYIALRQNQRPGLALTNGSIFIASGSHGDNSPWHGWMLQYDASTLAFVSAYCSTPNSDGGGIWMSGSAPVIDSNGFLYVITSNGQYDGKTEYGDSFLKLTTSGGLTRKDSFTPDDQATLDSGNLDVGAGGAVTLFDSVAGPYPHLLIGGGKNGVIYLLNRDNLGGFSSSNNNNAVQTWQLTSSTGDNAGISSSGAFWQNTFYIAATNTPLEAFAFDTTTGMFGLVPTSQSGASFGFPGLTPAISALGTSNGIVWAIDSHASGTNGAPTGPAVLYAFDASNLANELWDSTQGTNNQAATAVKFAVPTVANGKVYVGALGQLSVYGLLNLVPPAAAPTFTPPPAGYTSAQDVTLSDTTPGATIYYTTDGSTPTTASNIYSNPIHVSSTETISAMAAAPGLNNSVVVNGTYSIITQTTGTISFVQANYATPQSSQLSVAVPFTGAQMPGDLNVVVVGWNDSTATVVSITDSKGGNYSLAVGPTSINGVASQAIYYLRNIAVAAAGANVVTVNFSTPAAFPDVRIIEYSGADPNSPVDVFSGGTGDSGTSATPPVTTATANDLLFAANLVQTLTNGPGTGFTARLITSPDGDIAEDRLVAATGSYSATASVSPAGQWIIQMAAFRAADSSGGDTTPPTAPSGLTANPASATQINLTWTASTDKVGVTNYFVERCQGSGCVTFAQIASPTATNYSDAGLLPSTNYSYRVRATDAAGNLSSYSNISSTTTLADTTPPTAPSNLTATATTATQINLSWTASTDNVGVTGYLVERCQGSGCNTFAQIATPTATSFSDTGLAPTTSYSYRVQATDGTGNLSVYSNVASATTPTNDTTPPIAPSNLTATAVSSSQINISWTASTDNVGVTGYFVQRCSGSGCASFSQVASLSGTTVAYSDTGLMSSTSYSYRVQATDAAGNLSQFSNTATAITQASTIANISFVQGNFATPQSSPLSVNVTYTGAQTAGDLNVVVVGWNDSTAFVNSVVDSHGSNYTLAVGPTPISGIASQSIYYLKNIPSAVAGGNTVTVTFNQAAAFPDIRILEYSGVDPATPVDATSTSTGNSASSASAPVTTTDANDLLFGANMVQTLTTAAGTGFTKRMITSPDGDIAEDRVVSATGSYSATAPVSPSGAWIMQMVAFRAAGSSGGDTTPPAAPSNLVAAVISGHQINLSWTASTDNVGVTGYFLQRCSGSGCTTFAPDVSLSGTTTSYSDTGLAASTQYSYRAQATDAAGNLSAFSNVANATTSTSTGSPGLVAAYSFNEGSGTTAGDSSGNGINGTLVNATWSTSGKFGNSLFFNGTNAQVVINDSPLLHLTSALTLEAWINPSSAPTGWQDVIYKPNDNYFLEAASTNSNKPGTGVSLSNTEPVIYGTAQLSANTWTHLAATYDGTTLKMYVNGTPVSSVAQSGAVITSANALQIGGDALFGQFFNGLIDEVRIYNVALTQAQIQSDMTTPLP